MAHHCRELFPNGVILNMASVAPPPCKDYHQLYITYNSISFRWWKISLRSDGKVAAPGEKTCTFDDFLCDEVAQSEVSHAFGDKAVDYVMRIAEGKYDYLPRMSRPILFRIVSYLELEDTAKLSQVSHLFNEICESNEVWESIYHKHSNTPITRELETLAQAIGWKKLFFTNKLQIQVQLRRSRQKAGQDWTPMVNLGSDWSDDMELNSDFDLK